MATVRCAHRRFGYTESEHLLEHDALLDHLTEHELHISSLLE